MMKLSLLCVFTILSQASGFVWNSHQVSSSSLSAVAPIAGKPAEVIDEASAFAKSSFPIGPDQLIERAKQIVGPDIGIGTKDGGACLSDDFEFCAAVVGPIGKEEYIGALGSFRLEDSFDIQQNMFGFNVDPIQTNRVWFFQRQTATHVNDFAGVKASGKELVMPPQIFHIDFTEDGKVKELGFYTADRRQGNTGGLGGAFGYFYGVGKNLGFREAMPYKPSFRFRALSWVGALGKKLQNRKKD